MGKERSRQRHTFILLFLSTVAVCRGQSDLVFENVYEAALDLPRVLFAVQRGPRGPLLMPKTGFAVHYAFLDTGASGILMSRETATQLGMTIDRRARFVDVGVGGAEHFGVSEPLYLGLANIHTENPQDPRAYRMVGRARFQIKATQAGLLSPAVDIIGMPALKGRVVVLDTAATNRLGYCAATVLPPGAPGIPAVHITVALRFQWFSNPRNPENIPPLPVMAPNPVIDNIVLHHHGKNSRATWLLDTGGTISLISTRQAKRLGILDRQGKPVIKPAFSLLVGGVGQPTTIPGYQFERLIIPLRNGRNLIFKNARLGVHDIHYTDGKTQTQRTLDGVFGINFLCASAKMVGLLPGDISETPFDKVVIDMPRAQLGLRLRAR